MARLPVIRAQGQPELATLPRANGDRLDIGRAVTQLGQAAADMGLELQRQKTVNDTKDRENRLRSARVEAVTRLGEARGESEAEQEVDGLADRFEGRAGAIREEIAGRFEGEDAEEFGLIFDEVAATHRVGVGQRQSALRGDVDRDRMSADVNALLVEYGRTTDPAVRDQQLDQAASIVERAFAAGQISEPKKREALEAIAAQATAGELGLWMREDPARALDFLQGGGGDYGPAKRQELIGEAERAVEARATGASGEAVEVEKARIRELLRVDAARLADEMDAGGFAQLQATDPESWQMFRTAADAELAERRAKVERTAKDESDAALRALDAQISLAERSFEAGLPVSDPEGLVAAAAGTPYSPRVAALMRDRAEIAEFTRALPAERAARLNEMGDKPAVGEADIRRRGLFGTVHDNLRAAEERDILGHAARLGMTVPPVDTADPESLRWRAALSRDLSRKYAVPPRFFSDAEREQVLARFQSATPDQQVQMLGAMDEALGPDALQPLTELELADPLLAQAGYLVAMTGRRDTARLLLAGRQMIAEKDGARIAPELRQAAEMAARLHEALPVGELGSGLRSRLLSAADAIFVASVTGDPAFEDGLAKGAARTLAGADDPMVRAYRKALNLAAGATLDRNGEPVTGGFQSVNGRTVLLPAGVGREDLAQALRAAPDELLAGSAVSGQLPFHGERAVTREDRQELIAVLAGRDDRGRALYRLGIERNDGFEALADPAMPGGVALFDLEGLVRRWKGRRP